MPGCDGSGCVEFEAALRGCFVVEGVDVYRSFYGELIELDPFCVIVGQYPLVIWTFSLLRDMNMSFML